MVREDLLALHATAYTNFDLFFQDLKAVLEAYETVVSDARPICQQFGLRYIDIVVPETDRSPNDYVKPGLHGADLPFHDGTETAVFLTQIPRGNGLFTFRYTRQAGERGAPFPADLRQEVLKPASILERARKVQGQVGVLDFDRFIVERMVFNAEKIATQFTALHDDHSAAFRAIMSDRAEHYWNRPEDE
jgi:uncharacterized protein (TIGR04255 family)